MNVPEVTIKDEPTQKEREDEKLRTEVEREVDRILTERGVVGKRCCVVS